MKYIIQRPPLAESFFMSSRESLLKLNIGDLVKVIFKAED
jgi:hypothetical protein